MKVRNIFIAVMMGLLFAVPAVAQNPQGEFSALQGVEAQALSAEEMQAITGELNAYNIAAALFDAADRLAAAGFPRLSAAADRLGNYYLTNAEAINTVYGKLGVLTACTSALCPTP